jgi:hypothetical protein
LNNQDKEKEIEKLLREGVLTWNQICQKVLTSPNTISKVKHRIEQAESTKEKSSRTKALLMYNLGRTPFEVATELDISTREAEISQLEYWKLKGMKELQEVYQENGGSIKSVVSLYYELDARGMNVRQVFEALKKIKSVGDLKAVEQSTTENIQFFKYRLHQLRLEQQAIEYQLKGLQETNIAARQENANLFGLNQSLREENQRYRSALYAFLSSNGYREMQKVARSEIMNVMKVEQMLLPTVAASVVKALTTYPELQGLLSNPHAWEEIFRVGSSPNLPNTESQLLEESRNFYYQIKKYFTRRIVNDTIDTLGRNHNVPVYS